jgi:hypothetical protein
MNAALEHITIAHTITKTVNIVELAPDRCANLIVLTEPTKIATRITDGVITDVWHISLPSQQWLVIVEQHFVDFKSIESPVDDKILHNHIKLTTMGERKPRSLK